MLKSIKIKNFATIDNLEVEFCEGLNILSGETGAGKSIIIESINFLFGRTRGTDIIRTGEKECSVAAVFDPGKLAKAVVEVIIESGIELGEELDSDIIVKRTISDTGKSRYFVNNEQVGKPVSERLGEELVRIFGQNDRRFLIDPASQLSFLDEFAGNEGLLDSIGGIYVSLKETAGQIDAAVKAKEESSRISAINSYIADDMERLNIKSRNEDEILKEELQKLENANSIKEYLLSSIDIIENEESGISARLNRLVSGLSKLSEIDSDFKKKEELSNAENAKILIDEILFSLEKHSVFEFDEARLAETRARLDSIINIENKYGASSLEELLDLYGKAKAELEGISGIDDRISSLQKEYSALKNEFTDISGRLSRKRKDAAASLEKEIEKELANLGIKPVFAIRLTEKSFENGFSESGLDECLFMFSANPGEEPRPLSKVASGGELSRVSLCVLKIINTKKDASSFVFDEIDAGIGGDIANFVGEALKSISLSHQVILITHLAQVASFGDGHFSVRKEVAGGKTYSRIKKLSAEERIAETARMLSGDAGGVAASRHAEEILRRRGIIV